MPESVGGGWCVIRFSGILQALDDFYFDTETQRLRERQKQKPFLLRQQNGFRESRETEDDENYDFVVL
jgi:hypothetical protein